MATTNARETRWAKALRAALDDVLLDVRVHEKAEGYDFLLVYPRGEGRAAVERFVEALLRSEDVPPFEVMGVERERAGEPQFAGYHNIEQTC